MIKIPDNIIGTLKENMKSPQGTFSIKITFEKSIYEKDCLGGILFENIAGRHYFRLTQTNDLKIKFYHSSPGTGTRLEVVDISKSVPSLQVMFTFTWSPCELKLYVGPMDVSGGKLETSAEATPDTRFEVTEDGKVIEVGGRDIQVMGLRLSQDGEIVLESTAIESWNETLQATDVLMRATSVDGYMFEVVKSNFIVVNLVTGVETYCKRRLQELESEGIQLDYANLENKMRLTKVQIFAETSNYFQNLEDMKKIWKHLVDIKVYEISPVAWQSFKEKLYPHRHVVVHAHSLRAVIKTSDNSRLIFITSELIGLKDNCVGFIEKLHAKTLELSKK